MNCAESKKLVYLFFELDDEDQKRLLAHCDACADCSALLTEVKSQRKDLLNAFADATLEYPTVLTASVMREIDTEQRHEEKPIIPAFVLRLRHAFAFVSLLMAAFFVYESTAYDIQSMSVNRNRTATSNEGVVLNSAAVMKRIATAVDEAPATKCWRDCRPHRFTSECTECIEKLSKRNL